MERIYYFPRDIQAHLVFFILQAGYSARIVDGGLGTTVPHETLRTFLKEYGLDLDAFANAKEVVQ
jgi:transposase-like protein